MPRAKPKDAALGKAIRRARVSAGLSQAQLAEDAEVAVETISRIERGTIAPSVAVLVRIADVMDVSIESLIRGTVPTRGQAEPPEMRRILSTLRRLDGEDLERVHRGLQAFLSLRRPDRRRKASAR